MESGEDTRARRLLENTTRRVNGGYETGLLWKTDDVRFPDSRRMASRRLTSLEWKLRRDPELYDCVREQIREYQRKGYAHAATKEELSTIDPERTWYLPLGVVRNPKKPKKVRLIWDAAAKVNGTSFNSALLKGPDLIASLPAVLCNFRLYRYAVTGDIREMFHRIRIRQEDRQYQRFLWRNDPSEPVQVYIMDVATFGSTCSPCSAQFVKNLNANEFAEEYPEAVKAIVSFHYVDDYLNSHGTVDEAVRVGREVTAIHAKGGFELRNFLSNVMEISREIGNGSEEGDKSLTPGRGDGTESVLGVRWITSNDVFTYSFAMPRGAEVIMSKGHVPTKREVLRVVMSLFDPLGLISFFLVHGKILMQDIWASGTSWDDQINDKLCDRWRKWSSLLPKLDSILVPRCYFRNATAETYNGLQIHVFVDASEQAYACVAYFRVETSEGVLVALVGAKSKVAPLKMLTIPRLELQAAVLGTRLLNSVISMHGLSTKRRYIWTDSSNVLAWIASEQRRFHQFVGFRIGEILSSTEVSEWRWIPSKLNVADDATKWGTGPCFDTNGRWFAGPDFLREPEDQWPARKELVATTEEELRMCNVHLEGPLGFFDVLRFSRWERLQRTAAYVHRYIDNVCKRHKNQSLERGVLTQQELSRAERTLFRQVQLESYPDEIKVLSKSKGDPLERHETVEKSSPLFKMWPFMDDVGVVRKRSRLLNAQWLPDECKYPTVLSQKHGITFLLVDWYHRRYRHANRETVVNELRQRFVIPKLRALVGKVARRCLLCRVKRALPNVPPMAPLPKVRLTPFVRPFTYVGLDYFGPVLVKVGRSNVKRWVALFTCLTIRAVHLEIVHSLSTESCVMAVRRFVARRGSPAEIYSDNGTNFQGASRQLQREIEDRERTMATVFTNTNTRWLFNPPAGPHMGGAWERMVRSVKAAVGTLLEADRRPDDETLETVMLEAEAMINSRPLTYIPLESADQEALTPNHFILGNSNGAKWPEAAPMEKRATLRSSWKLAQHLTDGMWRRWIREYLPVISRRSKWFEEVREIREGDIVFVVEGNMRNQWIRGIVEEVIEGGDGRIRQAFVRTRSGRLRRPVVKLALIDVAEEGKPPTAVYEEGDVATTH